MRIFILVLFIVLVSNLNGCVTNSRVHSVVEGMQDGPKSAPKKTITNFSSSLHCMDDLLLDYRISQQTFLIESLRDETGRVSAGRRDMLITALAAMSRRSNAIKVFAYDQDSSNAIAFMERATGPQIYQQIPMYDIRGSVSQYDSRLASNNANAALSTREWGVGGDRRISGDIMGVDLSVARMADLSVIPSVTSSNQVIIMDSSQSADGDAIIKNSGVYFNFSYNRSEGRTQAARNLLDLAAIELIGRLVKVPYWHCLGISDQSTAIQQEVADWMKILDRDSLLVSFIRRILYLKGYYDAELADPTEAFQQAIVSYQQSVGMTQDGVVDQEFLIALLRLDSVERTNFSNLTSLPQVSKLGGDLSEKAPAASFDRMQVQMHYSDGLEISLNRDGFLYCYFQDEDEHIQRFYPNRFAPEDFLPRGEVLHLPGDMPFSMQIDVANNEKAACFATDEPVLDRLPLNLRAADFETLSITSLATVQQGYIKSALAPVGVATYGKNNKLP